MWVWNLPVVLTKGRWESELRSLAGCFTTCTEEGSQGSYSAGIMRAERVILWSTEHLYLQSWAVNKCQLLTFLLLSLFFGFVVVVVQSSLFNWKFWFNFFSNLEINERGSLTAGSRVVFQSPSQVQPFATLWTAACQEAEFSSIHLLSRVHSLQTHELQHARPLCPSPTPRVHPNPCPSSQWCHPTISSSVVPFSSYLQSFPASGSFQMSQLFASGGQSIGVSASTSVLLMNTQEWSPLGWTGSPCSPRDSQASSPTPQFKSINSLVLSILHSPTLTSIYDQWKNHSLD